MTGTWSDAAASVRGPMYGHDQDATKYDLVLVGVRPRGEAALQERATPPDPAAGLAAACTSCDVANRVNVMSCMSASPCTSWSARTSAETASFCTTAHLRACARGQEANSACAFQVHAARALPTKLGNAPIAVPLPTLNSPRPPTRRPRGRGGRAAVRSPRRPQRCRGRGRRPGGRGAAGAPSGAGVALSWPLAWVVIYRDMEKA